jgi:hypothetical protein
VNLLSLSLRNPRRLILAWLRCMGASARESRVSVAFYSLDVEGRPGLHQSDLTSLCFIGCFSLGPRKNDLTIYWALGPFVRSFTPLVDPGDIYPPHQRNVPVITRWREQYRGTIHLFIGTGRNLCIITFMPFTINYNNDTEYHRSLGHFIFKSVHPFVLRNVTVLKLYRR